LASYVYKSLYNPVRTFKNKNFYAAINNTDYVNQGALKYEVVFGYNPVSYEMNVNMNAPAYRPREDIRFRLLKRSYEIIDLPRPADDLLNHYFDRSQSYQPNAVVITDMKAYLHKFESFLLYPDTISDMKAITNQEYDSIIAATYLSAARAAQSARDLDTAEKFYKESSERYGKLSLNDKQIAIQKSIQTLRSVPINNIKTDRTIINKKIIR
jgi:hypothetical protein